VRRWTIYSAAIAPVVLIGGWTLAGARQERPYNPWRQTISALAAHGATDRAIMTTGLFALGLCHLATAAGLVEAGLRARITLAVGGALTIAVAALPQPDGGHVPLATAAFVALALWPAFCTGPLRAVAGRATAVLIVEVIWLAAATADTSLLLGLAERVAAGSQALCPLIFALLIRSRGRVRAERGRRGR
jgi:uncharacterized protein DUF998